MRCILKKLLLRKIPAAVLTAVLLFVTVFSMSIFVNASTTFTPRLDCPASSNQYYFSNKNVYYKTGWGMPNCTAYAFGRAYEILGKEPKLSWHSAQLWYPENISSGAYPYGKTPKLGAVACWSYSGGGHVAVVEKIEGGKITFSNSEWGGRMFYTTTADKTDSNYGGNSWWTFQGFIYLLDSAQPTYSTGIYKTNVPSSSLNMRSGAGTSYDYITSVPDGVKLTVTQIKENGGYTWGYTSYSGKKGWVALDYCVYVSKLPETQPTTTKPQPTTTVPQTTAKPTEPATTVPPTTTKPTEPATTVQPTTTKPTEPSTTVQSATVQQGLGVGDVNYDGYITITDATEIQKYLARLTVFTDEQIQFADFNFDGEVTISDASAIQRYLTFGW